MNNAEKLIEDLRTKSIRLHRIGDKLKWKAPKGIAIPDDDMKELKRMKKEILELVDGPKTINVLGGTRSANLFQADCLSILERMSENSVDLIVTDPPYGYKFMGKDWDKAVPSVQIWKECLRVLKPGGFAFIMSAPRQDVLSHMIVNLGKAGFRTGFTSLYWTYATGFPKAHNISKTIDKKFGKEREVVGTRKQRDIRSNGHGSKKTEFIEQIKGGPISNEAKKLEGSYGGFQPKPAVEVIMVVQKPPTEKTQVGQALDNGKDVTWLDDCRIPYANDKDKNRATVGFGNQNDKSGTYELGHKNIQQGGLDKQGRFPANLLVSDDVLGNHSRFFSLDTWADLHVGDLEEVVQRNLPYLIVPKASKKEKTAGLDNFPIKPKDTRSNTAKGSMVEKELQPSKNNHPTVKPIKLMSYLITLGSREGDVVLDPFSGSGTTCLAAHLMRRRSIGIEFKKEYFDIAAARMKALLRESYRIPGKSTEKKKPGKKTGSLKLINEEKKRPTTIR